MDRPVSDPITEDESLVLTEDALDAQAFAERRHEPDLEFESFVRALRQRGKL